MLIYFIGTFSINSIYRYLFSSFYAIELVLALLTGTNTIKLKENAEDDESKLEEF